MFALVAVILVFFVHVTSLDTAELRFLEAFINNTNISLVLSDWRFSRVAHACDVPVWSGLQCTAGSIAGLSLGRDFRVLTPRIGGRIPTEIGGLVNLRNLDLSENFLSGTLPTEIGSLLNLQSLVLGDNTLEGIIAKELGNLSNLTYLNLSLCSLGPIPTEFGQLTRLTILALDHARIGTLPTELGLLAELTVFRFDYSGIGGTLPTEYSRLSKLFYFSGEMNPQLSGTIPTEYGDMTSLRFLHLHQCSFSGAIPTQFGSLLHLESLLLSQNQLTGAIPTEFGRLPNISEIHLFSNALNGSIPTHIATTSSTLSYLSLGGNSLTGTIPSVLGELGRLELLGVGANALTGSLPCELGNLSFLWHLDCESNFLNGTLPTELGKLRNLQFLKLGNNSFSGLIPTAIGHLPVLSSVDLSVNSLVGSIPTEFQNLGLRQLKLAKNKLNGTLSATYLGRRFSTLTLLDLAENEFSGGLPTELGMLTALTQLHLSHNSFTGKLPIEMRNLLSLTFIDMMGTLLEPSCWDSNPYQGSTDCANDIIWPSDCNHTPFNCNTRSHQSYCANTCGLLKSPYSCIVYNHPFYRADADSVCWFNSNLRFGEILNLTQPGTIIFANQVLTFNGKIYYPVDTHLTVTTEAVSSTRYENSRWITTSGGDCASIFLSAINVPGPIPDISLINTYTWCGTFETSFILNALLHWDVSAACCPSPPFPAHTATNGAIASRQCSNPDQLPAGTPHEFYSNMSCKVGEPGCVAGGGNQASAKRNNPVGDLRQTGNGNPCYCPNIPTFSPTQSPTFPTSAPSSQPSSRAPTANTHRCDPDSSRLQNNLSVCAVCPEKYYNFDGLACIECPHEVGLSANCLSLENQVLRIAGDFRAIPTSVNPTALAKCPWAGSCRASFCTFSDCDYGENCTIVCGETQCAIGYEGADCSQCVDNGTMRYYMTKVSGCQLCPPPGNNGLKYFIFGLLVVIFVLIHFFVKQIPCKRFPWLANSIITVSTEVVVVLILVQFQIIEIWCAAFILCITLVIVGCSMFSSLSHSYFKILFFFAQAFAVMGEERWLQPIADDMHALSVVLHLPALSIDTGLECSSHAFQPSAVIRYFLKLGIPLIAIAAVSLFYLIDSLLKMFARRCLAELVEVIEDDDEVLYFEGKDFKSRRASEEVEFNYELVDNAGDESEANERAKLFITIPTKILHISLYIFYMIFFELELLVLYNFKCVNHTHSPGGFFILDDVPYIPCVGELQGSIRAVAIVISLFYLVGIPLCFALLLGFFRNYIRSDSPEVWWMEFLYFDYKSNFFYYEVFILIRKVLIGFSIVTKYAVYFQITTLALSLGMDSILRPFLNIRSLTLQLFCYFVLLVTVINGNWGIESKALTYVLILCPFVLPILFTLYDYLLPKVRNLLEEMQPSVDPSDWDSERHFIEG